MFAIIPGSSSTMTNTALPQPEVIFSNAASSAMPASTKSGGVMNRKELYVPGLIAALVPFNHKDMYFGNGR